MAATASKTTGHHPEARLSANLLSLTKICPVSGNNPEDCPLHQLRQLKPQQRVQWIQALEASDLTYLLHYHHICQFTKLELNPA